MGMIVTPNGLEEVLTMREEIEKVFPNAVFIEEFDHCIIGNYLDGSVVYSINVIISTLMSGKYNYCESDAYDYFDFLLIPQYSKLPMSPRYT
jgi:hypothetical protein